MSDDINRILCDDAKVQTINTSKAQYIQRIRAESAYPTFRNLVGLAEVLGVFCGAICIIIGLAGFFVSREAGQGVVVVMAGIILILIAKASKEASLMLADVADSVTEANSRKEDINSNVH